MNRGLIFGSLFIVGSILTGCGTAEERSNTAEKLSISKVEYMDEIENVEETQKVLSPMKELERENERIQRETEERNAAMVVVQGYGQEVYRMEDYWLRIPEYKDVKVFTKLMPEYWEEQKKIEVVEGYERRNELSYAAKAILTYINWFKDENEIEELGLTEVFDEWQRSAYEIVKTNPFESEWYEQFDRLVVEFEEAMYIAVEAINNLEEEGK